MGIRIGPKYKIARRLQEKIFPKTQTTKFVIAGSETRKPGGNRRRNISEYGRQLMEKQKAKYTYGVAERQFLGYIKKVRAMKNVNVSEEIFKLLETRLDNVVFRLGLVHSRMFARQVVSHGHILVNGKRVTVPSYTVRPGDKITVRPQSQTKGMFTSLAERLKGYSTPTWLVFDEDKMTGEVKTAPAYGETESNLNFALILEYYSRV